MVAMAASTYFFLNSFSYHDMTRNNLRGTPGPKVAHGIIKKNDGSSRSLLAKDLTKETSINHLKAIGVWGGGSGLTREMCKIKNLIWVMSKLQVAVDRYPIWYNWSINILISVLI
ncbi:putative oleoyl-[acyl-carrier-protein] hydrolase [Helianthus annuus]|nr:putative oleoyl-[acyl-carrier-protein] hydrolase [Helianthus annuus]